MTGTWVAWLHYWLTGGLLLVGLYGMLAAPHLVRKLMGMNIMQTSIIIFFLGLAAKTDATLPIVPTDDPAPAAAAYINPLPHALMLTAIVVGVSTSGVALALILRIHRHFGTLDERDLLSKLRE
ncbi:MAG: NADH-quinone oxidoreductase subunit J [Acidimicrobiia bacterium]|nr:NADH-quinone oxidoreductase subunit J [Acidimicrobiia bacterium]